MDLKKIYQKLRERKTKKSSNQKKFRKIIVTFLKRSSYEIQYFMNL
jgi:hypothetical protein